MENIRLREGFKGERSIVLPPMAREMAEADPILRALHVTDIGHYPHATFHYRERTAPIAEYVLIYCVKGRGHYRIDNRRYDVGADQFFILPAGKPHAYASCNADPWTIYWLHFGGEQAAAYAGTREEPTTVAAQVNSRIADRNSIFEDIFAALSDGFTLENMRYATSLLHFYLGSLAYLPLYRRHHQEASAAASDAIVGAALRYMDENLERQLSLQRLADYTGYSPSHFSLIFRNATGHSPLSYFNLLKVKRACQLLSTTDMLISQICVKVGIDDPYYFSRLFTKTVGISPRKYREK